jgi:hypothetical protein
MNLNHQAFKIKFEIKTKKSRSSKVPILIKPYSSKAVLFSHINLETITETQEIFKNLQRMLTKKKRRRQIHIKVNIK